jgi:biotin transport system substrate-specific component
MSRDDTTRSLVLAALFAALIAVGALVSVPMLGEVPFTLQVLFVLLAGLVLGPRWGAASVAAYLVLGLIAPVYAQGAGGLGVLLGPTGGYLWGFLAAVVLVGRLTALAKATTLPVLATIAAAGLVPVYALGALWLAWQLDVGLVKALAVGVVPFIPLDLVKAALAATVAVALIRSPLALPALSKQR